MLLHKATQLKRKRIIQTLDRFPIIRVRPYSCRMHGWMEEGRKEASPCAGADELRMQRVDLKQSKQF